MGRFCSAGTAETHTEGKPVSSPQMSSFVAAGSRWEGAEIYWCTWSSLVQGFFIQGSSTF